MDTKRKWTHKEVAKVLNEGKIKLKIKRFEKNLNGRDFAVGDIHGYFTLLQQSLDNVGFDPAVDRLFSVGDLADRGPESSDVDCWLRKPWFHAIRGNHEQMTIESSEMHFTNGGAWFLALPTVDQRGYRSILADLPLMIEVETEHGVIGIVHADVPYGDWDTAKRILEGGGMESSHAEAVCQWSRSRITDEDQSVVRGVRAVVCGHTPVNSPVVLGNVYHIDTGGWLPHMRGYFTILNLETLEALPPINKKIETR